MEQPNKSNSNPQAHLDFITGAVLFLICLWASVASIGYWKKMGGRFYASPGFMPILICSALGIMSLILMARSLKNSSFQERTGQLTRAFRQTLSSKTVHRATIGIGMFAVYVFGMLGKMPFWAASLLTLFAVLMFLRFDKTLLTACKLFLISALSIGGIILLFQVAFSVPMP